MILATLAAFFSLIVVLVVSTERSRRAREALLHVERAFDETIRVTPYDAQQLARLSPLVEQVGVVRIPEPIAAGEYRRACDAYEVFVLDTLGEVHDVTVVYREEQATEIVAHLAKMLSAEIIE